MEKRFKNSWAKALLSVLTSITLVFTSMIYFSPFGKSDEAPYQLLKHSVVINAPVEKVFQYLGNSEHAAQWSVFVDHIIPLNTNEVADGKVGSIRRCFQQANETGMVWDEIISEVIPNKKRQLLIYNLKNFKMTADNLATEQQYEKIGEKKCRLSFTLFFKDVKPNLVDTLEMYLGAYQIKSIFAQNMVNIKRLIEQKNNSYGNSVAHS